jgi:hypothetical protein
MRTISLRLDDDNDARLSAYCRLHGLTQTDAIKAAIAGLVTGSAAGAPSPAELAVQLGLIDIAMPSSKTPALKAAEPDLGSKLTATLPASKAEDHSRQIKQRLRERRVRDEMPPPAAR